MDINLVKDAIPTILDKESSANKKAGELKRAFIWQLHKFGGDFWVDEYIRLDSGKKLTKKAEKELRRLMEE